MAVATEGMFIPNMIPAHSIPSGNVLGDGLAMPEGEDSIQSLFQHSFDIWGPLDSMDI